MLRQVAAKSGQLFRARSAQLSSSSSSNLARLRHMVRLRLDRRLQGRIDPSDVLQDAHIAVAKRAREYLADPSMPAFLWLRWITGDQLLNTHRKHLGAQIRDANLEVSLHRGVMPQATSVSLAELLLALHLAHPHGKSG